MIHLPGSRSSAGKLPAWHTLAHNGTLHAAETAFLKRHLPDVQFIRRDALGGHTATRSRQIAMPTAPVGECPIPGIRGEARIRAGGIYR